MGYCFIRPHCCHLEMDQIRVLAKARDGGGREGDLHSQPSIHNSGSLKDDIKQTEQEMVLIRLRDELTGGRGVKRRG